MALHVQPHFVRNKFHSNSDDGMSGDMVKHIRSSPGPSASGGKGGGAERRTNVTSFSFLIRFL